MANDFGSDNLESTLNVLGPQLGSDFRVPSARVLYRAEAKFDYLQSLWQAERWKTHTGHLYLSPDGSPQAGWQIMCTVIDRMMWPKTFTPAEIAGLDENCAVERGYMPVSTLGYGKTGVAYEAADMRAHYAPTICPTCAQYVDKPFRN